MSVNLSIACSAANSRATQAAIEIREAGGTAIDALIAAHAVICVTMPEAAGLGGDVMALVASPGEKPVAVMGAGKSARRPHVPSTMGSQITVPGLVSGWKLVHDRWGRLDLVRILEPAITLARDGFDIDDSLVSAVDAQRNRLIAGGALEWPLLSLRSGDRWKQPELAALLETLATEGLDAFYRGDIALAIVHSAARVGSTLTVDDFTEHEAAFADPIETDWNGGRLYSQPPPAQGILLSMATQWVDRHVAEMRSRPTSVDHVLVEATEASFQHRDDVIRDHRALLDIQLDVDFNTAARRGGPRAYLHTAGVAVSTKEHVVSSLISVSSDFGSAVFVPELGIVLNDRAGSFTGGANSYRSSSFPVHTLAPSLVIDRDGSTLALATPGADGQVQTLLQILARMRFAGMTLADAIAAPRWRSENGDILIETAHPAIAALRKRGHHLVERELGDAIFGAVVAAGVIGNELTMGADHRRSVSGALA